jgi:hypothetical protein
MKPAEQNAISVYPIEKGSYVIKTGDRVTIIRFNH